MDDRTGTDATAGRAVGELSYTEASAELDEIVRFFEQRDVDVDQLVGRLVRATAIVEELDRRLRRTRLQVEQLVPRLTAVLSEDPVLEEGGTDRTSAPDETTGSGAQAGGRGPGPDPSDSALF